jgi:hypothetical protein
VREDCIRIWQETDEGVSVFLFSFSFFFIFFRDPNGGAKFLFEMAVGYHGEGG